MNPTLILINPWIYDFAAYDLWSKPLGLLYLAGYLRGCGFNIHIIDCLNVHHPEMKPGPSLSPPVRRLYGTGKFWRRNIIKPSVLEHVKRPYSRYGITRELFLRELKKVKKPAAILMTSLMTYWYPGVQEAITLAKTVHPDVPVILGGIYVKLCKEHALRFSGADFITTETDPNSLESVLRILDQLAIQVPEKRSSIGEPPYPAFDMLRKLDYVCILTSTGCPYRCRYCASHFIAPGYTRQDPAHILEEIEYWQKTRGIQDFAFYDDALLIQSENHAGVLLEGVIRRALKVRFHTPNALHVREITPEIARLLFLSGFHTIRLGLETADIEQHDELDKKIDKGEFETAVNNLKKAGFPREALGAYILMGLPGQSAESVSRSIKFVAKTGAKPYLAEYSPIPHTPLWPKAISYSHYDLASEPLFHNNTLLPCWDDEQTAKVPELKSQALSFRKQ